MPEQGQKPYPIEQILKTLFPMENEQGPEDPASSFQRFMDEMPGGLLIYRADETEKILYANPALLRIFQCETMEEFLELTGGTFRGIVYPEDLEAVEESIRTQIAASQFNLDYVEYRIRRKDGAIRWIEDYGHFVSNKHVGDVFYVFLADATERRDLIIGEKTRLMNEKLEEERKARQLTEEYDTERSLIDQDYLRHLEIIEGLSTNYEAICYLDLDEDQIVPYRLSQRTARIFQGHLKGEPYSWYAKRYVSMWVHPEDREMVANATSPEHIRRSLASSKTFYLNYRVQVDEELQYLQLRYVRVSRQGGACQAVMGYRRVDEEVQQQMEQQTLLAEALAKANLAITSKNTFLSNMSHDMRTPLHAIFGFTSLAKMSINHPEEATAYLNQVEDSSNKLLEMIEKVLEVSSMAAATGINDLECDLRDLAERVYNFLEPQAVEKSIAFTVDYSAVRHKDVFSDPEKLRQVILYLTNNAITYTNPGGTVHLSITEGADEPNNYSTYRISVKDNGIGISPEHLQTIFEPFAREKNSTLSRVHSIGLGLTIAKNIVNMMGGTLEVQSELDKGSLFTAVLHLRHQAWESAAVQPATPAPAKEEEEPAPQPDALRMLLVEDNELNRDIETALLERLNFVVDAVDSGILALERMRAAAPGDYDVILMDLQMPVMSGWDASRAIRELPDPVLSKVPIIGVSASSFTDEQEQSFSNYGINALIPKPIDLPNLLELVEKFTGKSCRRKK